MPMLKVSPDEFKGDVILWLKLGLEFPNDFVAG